MQRHSSLQTSGADRLRTTPIVQRVDSAGAALRRLIGTSALSTEVARRIALFAGYAAIEKG